ncbi:MAG: integration host factor subunit beta [Ignavibacteriales bacterium]|nr:integration host factor subunit beta [Ignavibacteriales bacterium]
MTKADLVDRVSDGTGLTKIETEAVIEGLFTSILDYMKNGKGIEIRGFGTFKVKKKAARFARNPKSGEKVFVPEHFVPVFKFSKDFKSLVNDGVKNMGSEE